FSEGFEYGLPNPPHRVRYEFYTLVRIELSNRFEKAFIPDCDKLTQVETVALVLLDIGDHEPEVRGYEAFGCFFVTLLRSSRDAEPCSREAHDNGGPEKRQQTVTGPLQDYAPNGFYVVDLSKIEGLLGISDPKQRYSVTVTE